MNKDKVKEILDKTNINVLDEIGIIEYIDYLQEENETLKEKVYNVMSWTVCGDMKQIKNTAQYKLDIAQDRISKAIEYIEDDSLFNGSGICANDLLDILRGEENE